VRIWRLHSRAVPVGDANQEHHQICGKRGGISPFGPSASPPNPNAHPLRGAPFFGGGSVSRN